MVGLRQYLRRHLCSRLELLELADVNLGVLNAEDVLEAPHRREPLDNGQLATLEAGSNAAASASRSASVPCGNSSAWRHPQYSVQAAANAF